MDNVKNLALQFKYGEEVGIGTQSGTVNRRKCLR